MINIGDRDHDITTSNSWYKLLQNKFSLLNSVVPISLLFGAGYYAAASFLLNDTDLFYELSSLPSSHNDDEEEEEQPIVKNSINEIDESVDARDIRLNYIITQVDISRMARNASRHLDVKSILALPTTVYHDKNINEDNEATAPDEEKMNEEDDDIKSYDNWSWQMVQQPFASSITQDTKQQDTSSTSTCSQDTKQQDNKQCKDEELSMCVICLEKFKHNDVLRVLPCKHSFHIHCIDHWLLGTYSYEECYTSGCPICKKNLIVNEDEEDIQIDGSSSSVLPSWAFSNIGNILAVHQQQQQQHDEEEKSKEVVILPVTNIVTISSSSSSSSNDSGGDVNDNVMLLDASDISCSIWQQDDEE